MFDVVLPCPLQMESLMQAEALDLRALERALGVGRRRDEGVDAALSRTVGVDGDGAWRLVVLAKRAEAGRLLVEGVGAT